MMREIKFRFIYKSENKYCHKVYSLKQLIERPLAELCDVHNDWELVETLQYTGLKDKNGKEIYEGDIVSQWHLNDDPVPITGEVHYISEMGKSLGWKVDQFYLSSMQKEIKVIDNIHEKCHRAN